MKQFHLATASIVKEQVMFFARLDYSLVVLAVVVGDGRRVLSVPQRTQHVREAQVLAIEGDQYLVANLRNHHDAAILSSHRHAKPGPVALARFLVPGETNFHPA